MMSQSHDPEDGSQLSVAELLARYGEPSPSGGRRRRRAADSEETAPHPSVERTPAAEAAALPQRPGRRRAADPAQLDFPSPRSGPYHSSPDRPSPAGDRRFGAQPAPAGRIDEEKTRFDPLPLGGDPVTGHSADTGSSTEQFPRSAAGPVFTPSPDPLPPRPPAWSRSLPRTEPPAGLAASATTEQPADSDDSDDRDAQPGAAGDLAGSQDAADHASASAIREWTLVAGQIGAGLIGGAVLWLACEWLWQSIPVLALIVALAVITGLVWVVRRVRRAEDLQTTVVAVLVGLFVTVSPAALLLLGR